jgi:hypothetical protein
MMLIMSALPSAPAHAAETPRAFISCSSLADVVRVERFQDHSNLSCGGTTGSENPEQAALSCARFNPLGVSTPLGAVGWDLLAKIWKLDHDESLNFAERLQKAGALVDASRIPVEVVYSTPTASWKHIIKATDQFGQIWSNEMGFNGTPYANCFGGYAVGTGSAPAGTQGSSLTLQPPTVTAYTTETQFLEAFGASFSPFPAREPINH